MHIDRLVDHMHIRQPDWGYPSGDIRRRAGTFMTCRLLMFHANGARLMWTEATLNETAQQHFSGAKKKKKRHRFWKAKQIRFILFRRYYTFVFPPGGAKERNPTRRYSPLIYYGWRPQLSNANGVRESAVWATCSFYKLLSKTLREKVQVDHFLGKLSSINTLFFFLRCTINKPFVERWLTGFRLIKKIARNCFYTELN